MNQIDKNTVKAENQLKSAEYVTYINPDAKGKRIMFVGNSITRHGVKEEIGWHSECGMAASATENDYVHIIMDAIGNECDAAFCICQISEWESKFQNGKSVHSLYKSAREFNADIIICRMIENCPADGFDEELFTREYADLVSYLDGTGNGDIIVTSGFWRHVGDDALKRYAEANSYPFIYLGDLGEDDDMKAIGKFAHEGVANHPGDKGMRTIAERILAVMGNHMGGMML